MLVVNFLPQNILGPDRLPVRFRGDGYRLPTQSYGRSPGRDFPESQQDMRLVRTRGGQRVFRSADKDFLAGGKNKVRILAPQFDLALDTVRTDDNAEEVNAYTPRIS
ncbi:hypothetical protein NO2_0220 [Candidatus Termititenax persephonae]|uniref:Uncharacterized protein n=1 Tax=Candidatus Termititenax persephonae TaxID=2218525 RepID=A0A388TEU3_9BACT|nr:hypothetical protein NO2_0220 [Candidatus Termititenax persephonae]